MIGDLCDCDRMLVECPGYDDCDDDPLGEEWGQEHDDDPDPTYDDTCCYEQGGPEHCECAERYGPRPVVTVQPTGGVL